MFNPAILRITLQGRNNSNISPFVGIQRAKDGKMEFCLPFGFNDFPTDRPEEITKFFFALYKTFQHFQGYAKDNFKQKSPEREGSLQRERGITFIGKDDESITLISKIANLESILIGYDELRIFSIVMRPRRTDRIDYTQISKYLHQAVFLKNHVPFIDEMIIPQPFIEYTITDLIRMYCFVYLEVKQQLEEVEAIPVEIINQAQLFRENNLQPDSNLFSLNHDFTIQLLRASLDEIHRQVSLKDDDYWHFYKALEDFLYGVPLSNNSGILWGITSFSLVWEDMCMVYIHEKDWDGVWFADSSRDFANTSLDKYNRIYLDSGFENPFYFALNKEKRHLRPDLVRERKFDIEEWFKEGFEINYIDNFTFKLTYKFQPYLHWWSENSRAQHQDYDNSLKRINYLIKTKFPSRKVRSITDPNVIYSAIYTLVSKQGMEQIINKIKIEREARINDGHYHLLVDFKYVNFTAFEQPKLPSKIIHDINKQVVYEYAVRLNSPSNLSEARSQFCIPYFSKTSKLIQVFDKNLNEEISEQEIEVLKVDYLLVQQFYNSYLDIQKT